MGRKEKHTLECFESGNPKIGDNWVLLFPPKGTCCPLSNLWCLIIPYIVRLFHSWLLLKKHQFFTAFLSFLFLFLSIPSFLFSSCLHLFANHSVLKDLSCMFTKRWLYTRAKIECILGDVGLRYCTVGSSAFRNSGSTTQSGNQLILLSCWFQGLLEGFIFFKCFEGLFLTSWGNLSLFWNSR